MRHAMHVLTASGLALAGCDTATDPMSPPDWRPRLALTANDRTTDAVFFADLGDCGGDALQGTGTLHTVIGVTTDAAGGYHLSIKEQYSNVRVTGSPSGASYVANSQYAVNITLHAGYEESVRQTLKLIGQGRTPNALVHFRTRIAVNANGEVIHDSFIEPIVECH